VVNFLFFSEQNVWPKRFEEEALMLTRRPTAKDSNTIDEDMLPPLSDSGDSDDSTGGQSVSDRDDEEPSMYNPNRVI
jgi:hypothetical protein